MTENEINTIWHEDSRNSDTQILSDYFNGFRLILRKYKDGYKFCVSIRRYKKHGIGEHLTNPTPVTLFKNCSLIQAKEKAIEHFEWMIQ